MVQVGSACCSLVWLAAGFRQLGIIWCRLVQFNADWYSLLQIIAGWCGLLQIGAG